MAEDQQSRPMKPVKDPAASPVARLFTLHTQRCQHTSSKLHRAFGHPVLHPRFPNDVDTAQLVAHHLRKACTCKGPPPTLQQKAATTLSGMSEAEVQQKVPQIVCPRCQHDLAFHRQRTPDENHNAAVLGHFRPELVDQCTQLPEPVLPRACPPAHVATRIETSVSIYKVQTEQAPQTPDTAKAPPAASAAATAPVLTTASQSTSKGDGAGSQSGEDERGEEGEDDGRERGERAEGKLKQQAKRVARKTWGSKSNDKEGELEKKGKEGERQAKQHGEQKQEQKQKQKKKGKTSVIHGLLSQLKRRVRSKVKRGPLEAGDSSTEHEEDDGEGGEDVGDIDAGGADANDVPQQTPRRRRTRRRRRPLTTDESEQDDDSGGRDADVEVIEDDEDRRPKRRKKHMGDAAKNSKRRIERGVQQDSGVGAKRAKRAKRVGTGSQSVVGDGTHSNTSGTDDDDRVSTAVDGKSQGQAKKTKPPAGSVLGFFSPAPKPKHTAPQPPSHPFKSLLDALEQRSSASRVEQQDDVEQLCVCDDATAVCIRTDAPHVVLLHHRKRYSLFETPESGGAVAVAAAVCAVDDGYGVVVITGRHNNTQTVHVYLASTEREGDTSDLRIEKRGAAVLRKGQAMPSALHMTRDAIAVGTWQDGLWLFPDPLGLKQRQGAQQQSLKAQHVLNANLQIYAVTILDSSAVLCACSDLRLQCISTGRAATGTHRTSASNAAATSSMSTSSSSSSTSSTALATASSHVHSAAITTVSADAQRGLALSSGLDGLLCIWRLKRGRCIAGGTTASTATDAGPARSADLGWHIEATPIICLELTGRLPILHHRHCDEYVLFIQREDASHRATVIRLPPAALHEGPPIGITAASKKEPGAVIDAAQDALTLRHIAGDGETIEFEDLVCDPSNDDASEDTQETILIKASDDDHDSRGNASGDDESSSKADREASRSQQNTPPLPNKPKAIVPS